MWFLFGTHSDKNSLGTVSEIHCSYCNNIEPWELVSITKYIILFWLPLPFEKQNLLICPICKHGTKLDDAEFEKYKIIAESKAEYWNKKGWELRRKGKYKEALDEFEKAIELEPQNTISWLNKGNTLDDMGKQEAAIEAYNKAIELDPYFAVAWYNKGIVFKSMKRKMEADEAFSKAKELGYTG